MDFVTANEPDSLALLRTWPANLAPRYQCDNSSDDRPTPVEAADQCEWHPLALRAGGPPATFCRPTPRRLPP